MRLATIQWCPAYAAVDQNVATINNYITAVDADVIVFPELSTSGYFFTQRQDLRRVAESVNGHNISSIAATAEQCQKTVVCGFAELDGEKLYNSALICVPGKPPTVYRKTHLFYKETLCFDEGNTGFFVTPLEHLGCTMGTMICYDWRFPESARTLALKGADVIVCPSNLVTHVWRMAMPVRALENKVTLAVANRTGSEEVAGETITFNGQSVIYNAFGNTIASATAEEITVCIAEIDPEESREKKFNSINDIFADRRPEFYS